MLNLLIVLVVGLILFGGVGYGYRDRLGAYYAAGTGLLWLLVGLFLVLVLFGAIHV